MKQSSGDRQLAERLLFEHGLPIDFSTSVDPEVVEIMAAEDKLKNYDSSCRVCGAGPHERCDAGLHS